MEGRKWRHSFKIKARPLKKEAHLGEIFSYYQLKVVPLFLTIISTNLTCRKNRSDTIKLPQSVHALCMCSSRTFPGKDLLITCVVFSNEKHTFVFIFQADYQRFDVLRSYISILWWNTCRLWSNTPTHFTKNRSCQTQLLLFVQTSYQTNLTVRKHGRHEVLSPVFYSICRLGMW